MVKGGMRNVAGGANPMARARGIEGAVEPAAEGIKAQARAADAKGEVTRDAAVSAREPTIAAIKAQARDGGAKEQIASVASSSAGDPEIGGTIADALYKVGKDGVITVEESNPFGIELEFTDGMQFDKGYISPYFITDP